MQSAFFFKWCNVNCFVSLMQRLVNLNYYKNTDEDNARIYLYNPMYFFPNLFLIFLRRNYVTRTRYAT